MSVNKTRRSFLEKVSLGLGGILALPFVAISRNFSQLNKNDKNMDTQKHPVLSVKPLGFQWETADPFLFCVHHEDHFPKGNEKMEPAASLLEGRQIGDDFIIKDGWRMYHGDKVPGFPGHPHRGFETITVVRKGIVDHADSLGAAGRYGHGDVQWMTAGRGVQHSEMFPLIHTDKENPLELFQIWLNLPARNKMTEPHFKMLWSEQIPRYLHTDTKNKTTKVEVIAGALGEYIAQTPPPNSWAADPKHEVAVWNIKMEAGAEWTLPAASAGINRTLYFFEGDVLKVNGTEVGRYKAIQVLADQALFLQNTNQQARILMLQGKPIGETVIQYGPFVMNTKEEIHQAFQDYQKTKFGGWPWPKASQVHNRSLGRFAQHADGKKEFKS